MFPTTDEIIEVLNLGPYWRSKAAALVHDLRSDPDVDVLPQSRADFDAALALYETRPDKDYSLTDCRSERRGKNSSAEAGRPRLPLSALLRRWYSEQSFPALAFRDAAPVDVTLEIKRGSKKMREVKLRLEETIVGRQDGCDMRIPSASVSRKHCRLSFRDGYLSVEDLASSNGTFLNGERVHGTRPVKPGDLLEIGPVTFLVRYELSTEAARELRKQQPPRVESSDIVDVEPVEVDEIVDVEPVDDQKQTVQFDLQKLEDESKKKPKKPERKTTPPPPPVEESAISPADVSEIFDAPLTIPVEEDLRDILSGLDDSKKD